MTGLLIQARHRETQSFVCFTTVASPLGKLDAAIAPKRVEARPVMEKIVPEGATRVNTFAEKSAPVGESGDITLSPFYHSSVNEITQPDRYVAMSRYFVRRWQAELGPTGVGIVLHLRGECYWNHKTRELRDTIQTTIKKIADAVGVSDKTVRREFADNKVLALFVRVQHEFMRDNKRGGYRNAPSTYQVSMDDPLHPDDESELIIIVRRKAQVADKGSGNPGSDKARASRETALDRARRQVAEADGDAPRSSGQDVSAPNATCGQNDRAQNQRADSLAQPADNLAQPADKTTAPCGQNDRALNHDSETTSEFTSEYKQDNDAQGAQDFVVYDLSFDDFEEQDEDAVREMLKQEAQTHFDVRPPAIPEVRPVAEDTTHPVPAPVLSRAVLQAAGALADASGLSLETLNGYMAAWRADGDDDAAIAGLLGDVTKIVRGLPDETETGYIVGILRKQALQQRAKRAASPKMGLESKISEKLEGLPAVPPGDLDSIRERHQALSDNAKAELRHRAEKIIYSAAGSLEAYKAIPCDQYRAAMMRVLPAVFLASERASQTKCTGEVAAAAGWNQELRAKIKGAKLL